MEALGLPRTFAPTAPRLGATLSTPDGSNSPRMVISCGKTSLPQRGFGGLSASQSPPNILSPVSCPLRAQAVEWSLRVLSWKTLRGVAFHWD